MARQEQCRSSASLVCSRPGACCAHMLPKPQTRLPACLPECPARPPTTSPLPPTHTMQVAHLSYHTAFPHTPFNPYHFLAPLESGCLPGADTPGSSSGSSIIALAMYSGGGVRYLHAAVGRQPAQGVAVPSTQPLSGATSEEGEEDSSTSNFPPPDATAAMVEAGGESPAGQRSQAPPPAAAVEAGTQQREQTTSSRNSWPPVEQQRAGSPAGSPWPRQRRRTPRRPPPCPSLAADSADCELGVRYTLLHSTHAAGRSGGSSWQAVAGSSVSDASGCAAAAVSCTAAPAQLDLEACIFAALQQQGLPPGALLDYAAAPIQACSWQGREGLLLLAVLRLSRAQPQENYGGQQQQQQRQGQQATRSACVLLHASAASGKAAAVEWLEPPYPWHDDLSAFLVQQTAFAGATGLCWCLGCSMRWEAVQGGVGPALHGSALPTAAVGTATDAQLLHFPMAPHAALPAGLAFEKAPAFFADFMRARWGAPPPRWRLPLVLTNRSVLGSGQSLQHIAHPWLPQAILGYGSDL